MIKEIDIDKVNSIPSGYDLVIMEKGDPDTALILYGFDELDMFREEFKNPVYGFSKTTWQLKKV